MEIRSLATQAMLMQEQRANIQMSMVAVSQTHEAQEQVAAMLAEAATTVSSAQNAQQGGFSTYV